ncbi:MAG: adenylate/guanylate cyclase domain-containing protein [Treponema sp.]|nr:adenylate/guanylate cyclase domain-containing protein [Treponema sp.]
MSERFRFVIKPFYFIIIFSVCILLTVFFNIAGLTGSWDKNIYDACIRTRVSSPLISKSPFIATIDLNDASIEILGGQLDTRRAFADIMEVLNESNASAVYDFLFWFEKTEDGAFVNAIESAGNTVVAALAVSEELFNQPNMPYNELTNEESLSLKRHVWNINVINGGKIPQAKSFLLPLPYIVEAAAQIALINVEPDNDGIYRRVPLLYKWDDGFLPTLSLAAGVLYWGIPIETIELKAGEYLALPLSETEVIRIPIDEYGNTLVPFTENWADQQARIPFYKAVNAKYDYDLFDEVFSSLNGKIALLAEISTSQKDFGPTAFEKLYPLSGLHAEILGGILDFSIEKAFVGSSSLRYKIIVLLLLAGLVFLFIHFKKDVIFHLGFLFVFIGFSFVTALRWECFAIAPWFSFPAVLLFLLWIGEFLNRLFIRYRDQLLMQNALSRYFPRALSQRIMHEGKTDLKPAYKELTVLFSDIAGFTKWSSDKSPEDVHNFLNEYLESMAEILFANGGTVDKFMGDGILAFFGDPFDMPNHTEQCIKAAIAMQKKAKELAVKWKPIVDIDLNVRVGLNTGKVIVGNLGSKTRIEYTVIGAAVNLAQRMESNAPIGGILVTKEVKDRVSDKFDFPQRKDVTVKGYDESIEAYIVGF